MYLNHCEPCSSATAFSLYFTTFNALQVSSLSLAQISHLICPALLFKVIQSHYPPAQHIKFFDSLYVLCSFSSLPNAYYNIQVDYDKLAAMGNFKTAASANTSFLATKKKILAGATTSTNPSSAFTTPKKTKAKSGSNDEVDDEIDDKANDEEEVTPVIAKSKKPGGRKVKTDEQADGEGSVAPTPKKRASKAKMELDADRNEVATPVKPARKKRATKLKVETASDGDDTVTPANFSDKKRGAKGVKLEAAAGGFKADEDAEDASIAALSPSLKKRGRKPKPEGDKQSSKRAKKGASAPKSTQLVHDESDSNGDKEHDMTTETTVIADIPSDSSVLSGPGAEADNEEVANLSVALAIATGAVEQELGDAKTEDDALFDAFVNTDVDD